MSVLEVLEPGLLTTVQDEGRPGWAHLGVPPAGAADPTLLAQANALVDNPPDTAALEVTLVGPTLRALEQVAVGIAGMRESDGARHLVPGTVLRTGHTVGARAYLAVRGGVQTEPVLGSRSADLLTGLGPAPVAAGDRIAAGDAPVAAEPPPPEAVPRSGPLRIRSGPRDDWFTADALEHLLSAAWRVTTSANRVGIRLDGPTLDRARDDELLSEGLVTGAIQVPRSGPILLLNDHPTTGGYPVIAVVAAQDLPRAGQLKPGDEVRFALA